MAHLEPLTSKSQFPASQWDFMCQKCVHRQIVKVVSYDLIASHNEEHEKVMVYFCLLFAKVHTIL